MNKLLWWLRRCWECRDECVVLVRHDKDAAPRWTVRADIPEVLSDEEAMEVVRNCVETIFYSEG